MKILANYFPIALLIIAISGCVSMADYSVAISNDGSFAAYDKQFAINPLDYPVFALISDRPVHDPEVGIYRGPADMTTDILPSDRWEITRRVKGKYLAYSIEYGYRYCMEQLSVGGGLLNKCDLKGRMDGRYYAYLYISQSGSVSGWQYVTNNKQGLFEKTWFKMSHKGDWSGQPWFKCIARCDKLSNMKDD